MRRERILATFARRAAGGRARRAVPVRAREVRARARAAARGRARAPARCTACSLRDILVSRRDDQRAHDERACALANAHLDAVLVHCDPRFARLEETFAPRPRARACRSTTRASSSRDGRRRAPRAGDARGRLGRRRARRRAAAARGGRGQRLRPRPSPMRLIAGPFLPARRLERAATPRRGRRARAACAPCPTSAPSCARPRRRSASAATTPRSRSSARGVPALVVPYATAEEDEQTPARAAARARSAPCACSTRAARRRRRSRARSRRCSTFSRAPRARPRRRARAPRELLAELAGRRMEAAAHEPRRPHAAPVRRTPVAGARRRRRARPSCSTAADLAKPWPLALVVDHLLADRDGAVRRSTPATAGCSPASPRSCSRSRSSRRVAQYASDLWLQSAGERITHELRVARLRPPAAALARLPPAAPEGRPRHPRDRRRQRDGRPVRAVARRDRPGRAARVGMLVVLLVHRPGARRWSRSPPRRCWRSSATSTAGASARRRAAARAGGRDRLDRQRGAVGDGGRQGVRLGGLRARARARAQRASGWPRASRSRGCRRASTGSSASLQRGRHRARARGRRRSASRRGDQPGRADRLRQLHAQGPQPAAQHRPRGDQGRGRDGARRADRRAAGRRRGARRATRRLPRRPRAAGDVALEDVSFAYGAERPGAARRLAARRGRRARGADRARRAPASRRSARSSPASTTRPRGAC